MTLLEQVEQVWRLGAEAKAAQWAVKLRDAKSNVLSAKKEFHEWYPLKVYLSYTSATKSVVDFSVRYLGQEVATLRAAKGNVHINIPPKTAAKNDHYFEINLQGTHEWRGLEAQSFRSHFQSLPHRDYHSVVKSEEHHIESEFLRHMKDPTSNKFNGTLKGIQPVMLGGFPFQFPLPISGNTGEPKLTNGNIDILARRGTGKGTKISIWELKRPKTTAHAISQAYIYSVTLLKMLRTPISGDIWYQDIIGFGNKVPDKLTIESVVAVSVAGDRSRKVFEDKLRAFKDENVLSIGNDTINLHIAHYQKDPLKVDLLEV